MSEDKIKVLLVNDDGWFANGIKALATVLLETERFEVRVVSPAYERSGVGHSITIFEILKAKQVAYAEPHLAHVPVYAVDGTPADCVKLAPYVFPDFTPTLVISGCNCGANVGIAVHASGTCGAAREAAFNNWLSIALSLHVNHLKVCDFDLFKKSIKFALPVIDLVLSQGLPKNAFLNVNLPRHAIETDDELKYKFTQHGTGGYDDHYKELPVDADGKRCFSLHGALRGVDDTGLDDMMELSKGWISVSLLSCLSSHVEGEDKIQQWPVFKTAA